MFEVNHACILSDVAYYVIRIRKNTKTKEAEV
jgi:hypothetical protein